MKEYMEKLGVAVSMTAMTGLKPRRKRGPIGTIVDLLIEVHTNRKKVVVIGNGGSAAIASHVANDFTKAGGIRSMTFSDPSAITCFANDFGYENVFSSQIERQCFKGDVLIAISSSGRSENIIRAVHAAKSCNMTTITFTGFEPDNTVRSLGDVNFYVPSDEYGFVELAHMIWLHAITDALSSL